MDEVPTYISVGQSIVSRLHNNFERCFQDDLDYISAIGAVVVGVVEVATKAGHQHAEILQIAESIKDYARCLYLELWLANCEESENLAQVEEEGLRFFNAAFEKEIGSLLVPTSAF